METNYDDIYIKISTPFDDPHAEQRHEDIVKTFKGLFHQWFNEKTDKNSFIQTFGQEVDVGELLSLSQINITDSIIETLQQLPENEQSCFLLTMIGFEDFLNKIDNFIHIKIVKFDATRIPFEFWFNYRKCEDMEPQIVISQLLPILIDMKTITTMLVKFVQCYNELSINFSWRKLYTYVFINLLNIYEKLSFRPNLKSIGGFMNIMDIIDELEQTNEQTN